MNKLKFLGNVLLRKYAEYMEEDWAGADGGPDLASALKQIDSMKGQEDNKYILFVQEVLTKLDHSIENVLSDTKDAVMTQIGLYDQYPGAITIGAGVAIKELNQVELLKMIINRIILGFKKHGFDVSGVNIEEFNPKHHEIFFVLDIQLPGDVVKSMKDHAGSVEEHHKLWQDPAKLEVN